jgi:lipopolysaccharide transport system ATP-binding protein
MPDPIITAEGLGKKYQIDHYAERGRYKTLRETVTERARRTFGGWRSSRPVALPSHGSIRTTSEEFWALRNVSFEVNRGEVVGIIGRNGAGKSTLLKILSRITEPSTGRAHIRGRVASLLEVGTGFHSELSGRENIFLNGAILGMRKAEIRRKFDEIVDFACIEKFLDTPVKRYSSGMYVRLAFAVAAHLEPEILVVDEVLAVGDAEFQKKCMGKMQDVSSKEGRTVLFVSHNMEAVDRLTSRCVLLNSGFVEMVGSTGLIVSEYQRLSQDVVSDISRFRRSNTPGTICFEQVWAEATSGDKSTTFRQGEAFTIKLQVSSPARHKCDLAIVVENSRDQALFTTHLCDLGSPATIDGDLVFSVEMPSGVFRSGSYNVSLAAFSPDKLTFYDVIIHVPAFTISGTIANNIPDDSRWGNLYFPLAWKPEGVR